jgi:two-component system alkaline phosphatase synthesis response regulator PhoP
MKMNYTTGEVAKILGTHPDTVRKYCDSGVLEAAKGVLSTHRRISRASLVEFLKQRGISGDVIDKKAPKKILIADDDASVREMIMHSLRMLGFPMEVEYADNGHQACIQAGSNRPDLIILDLMMPEMDGFQVLKNLRKVEETKEIPVLVVTAYGNPENLSRISEEGISGILVKPFSIKELQKKVVQTLKLSLKPKS